MDDYLITDNKIICLDLFTKVIYSFLNFSTLFVFTGIILLNNYINIISNIYIILCLMLSFMIGLVLLIINLKNYNQFLIINENEILVCSGKKINPHILERININELNLDCLKNINFDYSIIYRDRKIKLIKTSVSIPVYILSLGLPSLLFFYKQKSLNNQIYLELCDTIPKLEKPENINKQTNEHTLVNVLIFLYALCLLMCVIPLFIILYKILIFILDFSIKYVP